MFKVNNKNTSVIVIDFPHIQVANLLLTLSTYNCVLVHKSKESVMTEPIFPRYSLSIFSDKKNFVSVSN